LVPYQDSSFLESSLLCADPHSNHRHIQRVIPKLKKGSLISDEKAFLSQVDSEKAFGSTPHERIQVSRKTSMAGKKYTITVYLTNEKGESKPLNGTLSGLAEEDVDLVAIPF
jgi:hypothetical protein